MRFERIQFEEPEYPILKLRDCLAKTVYKQGERTRGQTVLAHCLLSGLIAKLIVERIPTALFSFSPDLAGFICSLHDIGKLNPGFQAKLYSSLEENKISPVFAAKDKEWKYHFSVGHNWLFHKLRDRKLPFIVGAHHGGKFFVSEANNSYGGSGWEKLREELIENLARYFGVSGDLKGISLSREEMLLLSGLTCVSDWIASCDELSDVGEDELLHPEASGLLSRINSLLDEAGLLFSPNLYPDLPFSAIFGFEPNIFQSQVLESLPFDRGIYLIESPMGSGKTELALYIAYKILEKKLARGIYFALPTRITSDSMYSRFFDFVSQILREKDISVNLIHSLSWMFEFGSDASSSGPWASSNRKAILAPFAVGTVDQVLLAVMNVYFFFVRLFGLLGKVIILDEVHSYDIYTGTILKELIQQVVDYKATLIVLSATLSEVAKERLLHDAVSKFGVNFAYLPKSEHYPQVSFYSFVSSPLIVESSSQIKRDVSIFLIHDEEEAIEKALEIAEVGGQVVWIENTVTEAQMIYRRLSSFSNSNVEVGLIHSRFVRVDRQGKESYWIDVLGKNGVDYRKEKGRILVGTQVLEQSLDIDGDLMITRLAPMDMLLQRAGRLWRHKRIDPVRPVGEPSLWILTPEYDGVKLGEGQFGSSELLYSPYYLYRTLEALVDVKQVELPGDIRSLLRRTYCDREEGIEVWQRQKESLIKEIEKMQRRGLMAVSQGLPTPLPDEEYLTRSIPEQLETVDVLLVRDFVRKKKKFVLYDGSEVCLDTLPRGKQRRKMHMDVMKNSIPVPRMYLLKPCSSEILELLSLVVPVSRGEYLDESGKRTFSAALYLGENHILLDFDGITELGARYSPEVGYTFQKE